jgi:hypothetical protein
MLEVVLLAKSRNLKRNKNAFILLLMKKSTLKTGFFHLLIPSLTSLFLGFAFSIFNSFFTFSLSPSYSIISLGFFTAFAFTLSTSFSLPFYEKTAFINPHV